MSELFQMQPGLIDILLVYDISIQRASQLAEKYVAHSPKFDLILIIGPFTDSKKLSGAEDLAIAEGDMASSIAQLENITCRVAYLPGENDPPSSLIDQLHLTPNSVNLYARRLPLRTGLYITGFTEKGSNLDTRGVPDDFDRSEESDEELEDVEVKSGASSIKVMKEILGGINDGEKSENETEKVDTDSGIFLFSYKFTHTLNHFLFHMGDDIVKSKVNIVIIPPSTEDALRLPPVFGPLKIIVPKSLRDGGNYCTFKMNQTEKLDWIASEIEHHVL